MTWYDRTWSPLSSPDDMELPLLVREPTHWLVADDLFGDSSTRLAVDQVMAVMLACDILAGFKHTFTVVTSHPVSARMYFSMLDDVLPRVLAAGDDVVELDDGRAFSAYVDIAREDAPPILPLRNMRLALRLTTALKQQPGDIQTLFWTPATQRVLIVDINHEIADLWTAIYTSADNRGRVGVLSIWKGGVDYLVSEAAPEDDAAKHRLTELAACATGAMVPVWFASDSRQPLAAEGDAPLTMTWWRENSGLRPKASMLMNLRQLPDDMGSYLDVNGSQMPPPDPELEPHIIQGQALQSAGEMSLEDLDDLVADDADVELESEQDDSEDEDDDSEE